MPNIDEEFKLIEDRNKKLIEKSIEIMKTIADPKHSVSHMQSVVNYTKEILEKIDGVENIDKEVCILSAYWHDTGRSIQAKGHSKISANMIKEEMEKLGYNDRIIESCYKAICNHGWNEEPETLEGIIVRDADKIDFVGIQRWKNCIENSDKLTKILELMPTMRKNLLKLECSREIFDREIANLVIFLHDKVFNMN